MNSLLKNENENQINQEELEEEEVSMPYDAEDVALVLTFMGGSFTGNPLIGLAVSKALGVADAEKEFTQLLQKQQIRDEVNLKKMLKRAELKPTTGTKRKDRN
jgi:hypothetical protein